MGRVKEGVGEGSRGRRGEARAGAAGQVVVRLDLGVGRTAVLLRYLAVGRRGPAGASVE